MHLAWRWFTGLTFDQEVPHHSPFSENCHGRFQESKLVEQLFREIVERCVACGLVKENTSPVDGSFIQADANNSNRVPRERVRQSVDYGSRRRILQQRRQGFEARIFRQLSYG
jgi:transposase